MYGKTSKPFGYLLQKKLIKAALSKDSIVVNSNKVFDDNILQQIAFKQKIDTAFDFYCRTLQDSLMKLVNSFSDNHFDVIIENVTMDKNFIYLYCFAENDSLEHTLVDIEKALKIQPCQMKEFSVFFNQWFPNKINPFKMKDLLQFLEEIKIQEPVVLTHISKEERFYSVAIPLNNFIY